MTAVEWFYQRILSKDIEEVFKKAKAMENKQKIEFACKVAEVSAEKYIQGKTTEQIAEELIKQQ